MCAFDFIGLSLLLTAPAASALPLQPIKPWVIDYADAECNTWRSFGTSDDPIVLGIRPSPGAENYEILLIVKQPPPRYAEEFKGSIDFGRGPIKSWPLHYSAKDPKFSVYQFRISASDMAKAESAPFVTINVEGFRNWSLALQSMPALLSGLRQCDADLQHYWNMTPDEQKLIKQPAVGDVRSAFSDEDYPDEAWSRGQEGSAQFLLLIDSQGKIAACDVLKPSGLPVLDGMGCQTILRHTTFKPAYGRDGKPLRSVVITPPITWQMESQDDLRPGR